MRFVSATIIVSELDLQVIKHSPPKVHDLECANKSSEIIPNLSTVVDSVRNLEKVVET
nr:11858_t:CDS:2 [Entrophospora candida]